MVGKTRLRLTPKKQPANTREKLPALSPVAGVVSGLPGRALQLQATAGNRALQRLIQRDSDEDRGADLFNVPGVKLPAPGGGHVLPDDVRSHMEQSFGQSFADVRVHESTAPKSVGAVAYTQGSDIHFSPGKYRPESESGRSLIGHELTHVVQQRAGVVSSPQGSGAPVNASPQLEDEAARLGASAARGNSVSVSGSGSGVQRSVAPVQRVGDDQNGVQSLPGFGQGRTRALAAFFESGGNPAQADDHVLAQVAPSITALVSGPMLDESDAITPEVEEAAEIADENPEAVLEEAGAEEDQSQAAPSGDEAVSAVVKQSDSAPSSGSGGMTVKDGPSDAAPAAAKDLRTISGAAKQLMAGVQAKMAEMKDIEGEVTEERAEEERDMALEQLGAVGVVGEAFKESEGTGKFEVSGRGVAGGTLAAVGVVGTLANAYLNIKDAYETLNNETVDVATRYDAVGQITEAIAEAGSATSSAVEIFSAWGGAADSFLEAAGNWGAAFGIAASAIAVGRGVGKGLLARSREKKMGALKDRRSKGQDANDEIAEAAGAAEKVNKSRKKAAVAGATKGAVTLAAGIIALTVSGPVGWGIAATVGLGSAVYAGYKLWKRKKRGRKEREAELEQMLKIGRLIEKGLKSTDDSVKSDYQQIALSLGASKKKVMAGTLTAKEIAKLMGRS